MTKWDTKKQPYVFTDQATVLLEGNGKRCERLHPMMSCMSSRESTSPVIPTTRDGNTRQTFRQDRNGLSYRFHGIQQGK